MDVLERMPWAAQNSVFQKLASIAEVSSLSKEERQAYDESLRQYRDTISVMQGQWLEGHDKGLAEGMEKGMMKGMEKGKAEGQQQEKVETVRRLQALGLTVDQIAQGVGLTAEEVKSILA